MPVKKKTNPVKTKEQTPPELSEFDKQIERMLQKVRVTVFNNTTSHDEPEVPQFIGHINKVIRGKGTHYLVLNTGHTFVTTLNELDFDFEGKQIILEPSLEIFERPSHFLIETDPDTTPVGGFWNLDAMDEGNPRTMVCHPWTPEDNKELLRLQHAAALRKYIEELNNIIETALPAIDLVNMAHYCKQIREMLELIREAAEEMRR